MGSPDDPFFGGSDKLYYSTEAERMVAELERWHVVAGKVDAYQLGLAIGIRAQKAQTLDKPINFGNLYSLRDEWVVKMTMFHLYPDLDPKDRKDRMDQHAEAGIRMLYEHVSAHGGAVTWQDFIYPTPRVSG